MLFKREPALILGFINAVLALLLAFGVDLSEVQIATILAVSSALLALITRQVVATSVKAGIITGPK